MSNTTLTLTSDSNMPAMTMTGAQVNHLRRLLAWMRCEYMLDENALRCYIQGAEICVANGMTTPEQAGAILQERADKINQVPAYVRQGVRMLTKALREHERQAGIVEAK